MNAAESAFCHVTSFKWSGFVEEENENASSLHLQALRSPLMVDWACKKIFNQSIPTFHRLEYFPAGRLFPGECDAALGMGHLQKCRSEQH